MNHWKKSIHSLRGFLLLWVSQSISTIGTAMTDYALIVWIYGQNGTASSVSMLTLCSFMPTILFRFVAGAVADRWNKKYIMLAADLVAACGSLVILLLFSTGSLTIPALYIITFLLSLMNAFQVPAAYVATSLLIPEEHYTRAGGLQAFSGAAISILSPALAGVVLAWGGMRAVLLVDLCTFAVAFGSLVFLRIPTMRAEAQKGKESVWQNCLTGFRYLKAHPYMLRLILFIAAVNLLAKLGADGQLAAFVLSRSGDNHVTLGLVQSCMALGPMVGGLLVTIGKPSKDSIQMVFVMCCCIFLAGIALPLCRTPAGWCVSVFVQYLFAAVMNVHWNTVMRSEVPPELLGRVYSTRDTLQNGTIPLGLFLGGWLADHVFTPLMSHESAVRKALQPVFGTGKGAGMAVLFLLVGVTGLVLSMVCMRSPGFRRPEQQADEPKTE
ncbi:MAG: MFS transporter [Clostridiales bacterium]|nr:MFS transporter [Clostridiales bacterium]